MQPRFTTFLGVNHLAVCCDAGQLTFGAIVRTLKEDNL